MTVMRAIRRHPFAWTLSSLAFAICHASGFAAIAQGSPGTPILNSAAGEVGRRSTNVPLDRTRPPNARVDGRIANRVESRLHSRIDRVYDGSADAASSLKAAVDSLQSGNPDRRRR
ncbi:hypothetical protein [Sphingomonas sp. Leaf231]|uniref:hypothetical protein n=1 Tax=Sphingomonas sp. Leaf231 TaxID=1736301 RepID=UPI0012E10328|nr:hypothetical protein [Sphingomonas sp. Leaf231]